MSTLLGGLCFGLHPSSDFILHFASGRGALMGTAFALGAVVSLRDQAVFALRLSLSQRSVQLHETMLQLALALLQHCEALDEAEMYLRDILLDTKSLSRSVHTRALFALARRELCLLSRRDVSVDEALSIQSSSSSVLLRALDLDRNNDEQKHGQLPPNPLVKMGLGACVWLDHRIRVPFELDGRDQVLALSL
eukprot:g5241.t1